LQQVNAQSVCGVITFRQLTPDESQWASPHLHQTTAHVDRRSGRGQEKWASKSQQLVITGEQTLSQSDLKLSPMSSHLPNEIYFSSLISILSLAFSAQGLVFLDYHIRYL